MPYLTNLADVARSAGLTVVEQAGWKTRGHGTMIDVQTVTCHHTAGPATGDAPSLQVVQNGRSDLAGPLAHFVLARSGVVYVVAAGQCWHTGASLQPWQSNAHSIGIEAEATGVDPWPEVQVQAYAKLCAALCRAFQLPVARVLGHKEVCAPVGRKPDPNFDMNAFRARVAAELNPSTDWMDMATKAEVQEAFTAALEQVFYKNRYADKRNLADEEIQQTGSLLGIQAQLDTLNKAVVALTEALTAQKA